MPLDLSVFERSMPEAVRHFWKARLEAAGSQRQRGMVDQGNRAGVTAGKNLDGFISMVRNLVVANGIPETDVFCFARAEATLPGFYRPTKNWDLLVVSEQQLVAAVEFKSQVGPSFGNNFNNRVEEALGNGVDLNTAFREGVFGTGAKPFVGYFFVLEDSPQSAAPVRFASPHFRAMPEFDHTSYIARYEILCRKLVQEQLYDAAALVLTARQDATSGQFRNASQSTTAQRFAAMLAGRVAAFVAGQN